jgi:hypothetical protein
MLASFSLAGCNDTAIIAACPPLKTYSRETQARVAAWLRKQPPEDVARLIRDYGALRAACRTK